MPDSYKELIKGNLDETEIRSFLVDGDQVSVTLRIPDTLRDAAKEEAALRGMSFFAFVRTHGSHEPDNSATPKPYVDPYKEEAVERLHERILFRMAVLGYDLDRVDQGPAGAPAVFHTKKNGIRGAGRHDKATGHFTVLAGSKVNLSRPVLKNAGVAAARREIFSDSGGIAELAGDLEFPTPSAAAVFVLGGSQNGWTEWVSDDGETLNQVYRSEETR